MSDEVGLNRLHSNIGLEAALKRRDQGVFEKRKCEISLSRPQIEIHFLSEPH